MDIRTYTLPKSTDVPPEVEDKYYSSGFHQDVRDFHLDRLPRYTVRGGKYVRCPHCQKLKDRRSMQIDHIIPAWMYMRYYLYMKLQMVTEGNVRGLALAAYNDPKNLLLICMRCNTTKGDGLLRNIAYKMAIENANNDTLKERLRASKTTAGTLRTRRVQNGIDVNEFIVSGPTWSTSQMVRRSADKEKSKNEAKIERKSRSKYDPGYKAKLRDDSEDSKKRDAFKAGLSLIHNTVVGMLQGTRPPWNFRSEDLAVAQPFIVEENVRGRLCFYCMGLFHKQAFQIDHINPTSRHRVVLESLSKKTARYNKPENLIPVCRTCNTSKGDMTLTRQWLDQQIERRRGEFPGIENAVESADLGVDEDAVLTRAKEIRDNILGLN